MKNRAIIYPLVFIFLSLVSSCFDTSHTEPQEPILIRIALGAMDRFNFYWCLEGTYGYIDTTGRYVINPQFDGAWDFHEGLASVKLGDKYGYIDTTGRYVINPQFDDAWSFHEGLARVELGDKCGYIDTTGRYVINPQFDDAEDFNKGLARVWLDGKMKVINKKGIIIWEE